MGREGYVLNDGKEQLLAPTEAHKKEWMRLEPQYQGTVGNVVKDLGIAHHAYRGGLPTLAARLEGLAVIALNIQQLPEKRQRAACARSVILGRGLHGVEVTGANQRYLDELENTWQLPFGKTSKCKVVQRPYCFTKRACCSLPSPWRSVRPDIGNEPTVINSYSQIKYSG